MSQDSDKYHQLKGLLSKIKKYIISIYILVISNTSIFAQGINFHNTTFQQASEAAKKANKILFVEVYLNGCPHCAALAPILQEKRVGDFYNTNFVSIKIEANSEDSKFLQQQKGLAYVEFPMFFFFDQITGTTIHQASPAEQKNKNIAIEEVIKHGTEALNPNLRTISYPNRFAKGERDFLFLVNYAKFAKATKNSEMLHQLNIEIAKIVTKPVDLEGETGFYLIQRLIDDYENPIAKYFFRNLEKYKSKYSSKDVKDAGENIIYTTLYGSNKEIPVQEIKNIRQSLIKLGVPAQLADARTVLKEIEAYFKSKNTLKATERLNEYRKTQKLTIQDYAYLIKYFNEKATDNSYTKSQLIWVEEALKLAPKKDKKEVADVYLEQGKTFLRLNKKDYAKKSFNNAVKIAQMLKIDTKPYSDALKL